MATARTRPSTIYSVLLGAAFSVVSVTGLLRSLAFRWFPVLWPFLYGRSEKSGSASQGPGVLLRIPAASRPRALASPVSATPAAKEGSSTLPGAGFGPCLLLAFVTGAWRKRSWATVR